MGHEHSFSKNDSAKNSNAQGENKGVKRASVRFLIKRTAVFFLPRGIIEKRPGMAAPNAAANDASRMTTSLNFGTLLCATIGTEPPC